MTNLKDVSKCRLCKSPPVQAGLCLHVKAYAAGIIDGEGCVALEKAWNRTAQFNPTISISNTDKRLLTWFQGNIPYKFGITHIAWKNANWKPAYVMHLRTKSSIKLLKEIIDLLILKQDQAKLLLEYDEKRPLLPDKMRLAYYDQVRILNKRGM